MVESVMQPDKPSNWNLPNILTSLRILFIPVFAWLVLSERWWWAFGLFVALMITDKLDGDIDFAALRAAKLVPSTAKRAKIVKKGELSRKLTIKGVQVTAGAKTAIEAAGGTVEDQPA